MHRILTVIACFFIMLCIGSIYAWSIIASELIEHYQFHVFQSQILFGVLIAVFPLTMIFAGKLGKRIKHRYFGYISGILFLCGYTIASFSHGNFFILLLGIGLLAGTATGFGYWVALTTPVQWFPHRKGIVTGITAAGFGLGAVFLSQIAEILLVNGYTVLQLFKFIGIVYGLVIIALSTFIRQVPPVPGSAEPHAKASDFIRTKPFVKLFAGIFLGTFAGLLIIGSLRLIGGQYGISAHILILGVAFFAVANFLGRILWGLFSDHVGAGKSLVLALLFQSVAIASLALFPLSSALYLFLVVCTGFGFGGNFVLFAKETAQLFGLHNLGTVYPYVFMGYAIAGIAGPLSGGALYDHFASFTSAILLASLMSLAGGLLFVNEIRSVPHEHRA